MQRQEQAARSPGVTGYGILKVMKRV